MGSRYGDWKLVAETRINVPRRERRLNLCVRNCVAFAVTISSVGEVANYEFSDRFRCLVL